MIVGYNCVSVSSFSIIATGTTNMDVERMFSCIACAALPGEVTC